MGVVMVRMGSKTTAINQAVEMFYLLKKMRQTLKMLNVLLRQRFI